MSLSNGTGLKWPTDSSLGGHGKKRHPHAQRIVSFMYNPDSKRRSHLLSAYISKDGKKIPSRNNFT
jgi:hypothetical protein